MLLGKITSPDGDIPISLRIETKTGRLLLYVGGEPFEDQKGEFNYPNSNRGISLALNDVKRMWGLDFEQTNCNLPTHTCLRCGHVWIPRKPGRPGVCPKCKKYTWDRPR